MELSVLKAGGGKSSDVVKASDVVFGRELNEPLIHQIVVGYMANARQGTRAQKTRSEVAKSTRKPWKQKGTGRARAGMASSPIWRGGGRTFPSSTNENFTHKINRKMYRAGMQSILSGLAKENRLQVIDDINLDAPKTKQFIIWMKNMGVESALIITDDINDNLYLASRNVHETLILLPHELNPYTLVCFPRVLVTKSALSKIEEQFA